MTTNKGERDGASTQVHVAAIAAFSSSLRESRRYLDGDTPAVGFDETNRGFTTRTDAR